MKPAGVAYRCGWIAAVVAASLPALSGCKTPMYRLAIDRPLPSEVVFRVDDKRPTWERKYYLGGKDDKLLKNAVNFIPVERIDPSPWELIRQQVENRFTNCGARPKSVVLEVRSCRMVENFNRTDSSSSALSAKTEKFAQNGLKSLDPPQQPYESSQKEENIGGTLLGAAFVATAWVGYRLSCIAGRHTAHWLHILPGKAGPPSQIDVELYPQGVTFELAGEAVVTFVDGSEKRVPIQSVRSVFGRKGAADAIKRAVQCGVDETADSIVRQSLGLPPVEVGLPLQNVDPAGGPPLLPLSLSPPQYEAANSLKDDIRRIQQSEIERNARVLDNLVR